MKEKNRRGHRIATGEPLRRRARNRPWALNHRQRRPPCASGFLLLLALLLTWSPPASAAILVDPSAGPNAPGSMVLEWSTSIDLSSLSNGLVVEQLQPGLGWVELPSYEVVVGTRPGEKDSSEILVRLRSGWPRGTSYRIRLLPEVADRLGRILGRSHEIEWSVPVTTPENPEPNVTHDQRYPPEFDSAAAAADTVGRRFPGGQPRLFQGLLHDPITGLAYARNRWYDPRNAGWLTEDPLLDVDSPNLYSFVAWQPNMATDPMGLYGEQVHFGMTAYLARLAGFTRLETAVLAHSAQRPDDDIRSPVPAGLRLLFMQGVDRARDRRDATNLRLWHFPLAFADDEVMPKVVPLSREATHAVEMGIKSGDLKLFGEGLHPLQDSFAHQGEPAVWYFDEELGLVGYGHPVERKGPSAATDDPALYPEIAFEAVRATFEKMLEFRAEREKLGLEEVNHLWIDYLEALPEIGEFIHGTEEERTRWLASRGIVIQDE